MAFTQLAHSAMHDGIDVCRGATSQTNSGHCHLPAKSCVLRQMKQKLHPHTLHFILLQASSCVISTPHLGQARVSGTSDTKSTFFVLQVARICRLGTGPWQLEFPQDFPLPPFHYWPQYQQNSTVCLARLVQVKQTARWMLSYHGLLKSLWLYVPQVRHWRTSFRGWRT